MTSRIINVLFLGRGNCARSIFAEAYLNSRNSHFKGYSAGAEPRGNIHPLAYAMLINWNLSAKGLRSKGWQEFVGPTATPLDLVVHLVGEDTSQQYPTWPNAPAMAKWLIPDPIAVAGPEVIQAQAFISAAMRLKRHIDALIDSGWLNRQRKD